MGLRTRWWSSLATSLVAFTATGCVMGSSLPPVQPITEQLRMVGDSMDVNLTLRATGGYFASACFDLSPEEPSGVGPAPLLPGAPAPNDRFSFVAREGSGGTQILRARLPRPPDDDLSPIVVTIFQLAGPTPESVEQIASQTCSDGVAPGDPYRLQVGPRSGGVNPLGLVGLGLIVLGFLVKG
jgi:hypothetical protein